VCDENERQTGGNGMTRQVQGVIHGKTIELDGDLGIADGQRVFVQVRVAQTPRALASCE
jgi:hypothetical protein